MKDSIISKKEFAKEVIIYKSHILKNNFISITYAAVLSENACSTPTTVQIENMGGALTSLYNHRVRPNEL